MSSYIFSNLAWNQIVLIMLTNYWSVIFYSILIGSQVTCKPQTVVGIYLRPLRDCCPVNIYLFLTRNKSWLIYWASIRKTYASLWQRMIHILYAYSQSILPTQILCGIYTNRCSAIYYQAAPSIWIDFSVYLQLLTLGLLLVMLGQVPNKVQSTEFVMPTNQTVCT